MQGSRKDFLVQKTGVRRDTEEEGVWGATLNERHRDTEEHPVQTISM